jgi:hypothetical protein
MGALWARAVFADSRLPATVGQPYEATFPVRTGRQPLESRELRNRHE